jgi:hypothetical protein
MRILSGLIFLSLASVPANAAIIQVDYTGTYSGSMTTGNPAISQSSTVQIGPTAFSLTFTFDTLTPFAYFSDTTTSSGLAGYRVGSASGSFFSNIIGTEPVGTNITSTGGSTSHSVTGQVFSKSFSNQPLSLSVSHPDIPGSILQPFTITGGLVGFGSYSYSYTGNFSYISESYSLIPETITVTVDGLSAAVPEPSTWAMLLIGFAGVGFATYRRRLATDPAWSEQLCFAVPAVLRLGGGDNVG